MAKNARVGTDSRLMAWERAVDACEVIWEAFEKEYQEQIAAKLEQASAAFTDTHISSVSPSLRVEDIQKCKANFERMFTGWKKRALDRIEKGLLKQSKKVAHVGPVSSRNPTRIGAVKPKKKRGRKTKNPPSVRRHVKTGRRRGWNNSGATGKHRAGRHFTKKESAKLARIRRDKRGKAARIFRRLRGWKPYPRHRQKA